MNCLFYVIMCLILYPMLLYLCVVFSKNFGIFLNASKGFQNYRHMTNLKILNDLMGRKREIINFYAEDLHKDDRNLDKSKVHIDEQTILEYKALPRDGYTIRDFLNVLRCNTKKMKKINKSSNVVVYLTGHGNDSVFKFHDREWLCCDDLMASISFLSRVCGKILLIVDTCQAETMIIREDLPRNVFAVTTSVKDESSLSSIHSSYLGVSCVDNFVYYFYKLFNSCDSKMTLVEFFSRINKSPVGSKITFSSHRNFYVSDFFEIK